MPDPTHIAPGSPLCPAPLPPQLASNLAQLVLPTLHAQPQTYTTTQMSYGLVSCFRTASVSVGKNSPSLSKWVTGAKLHAASTSTTKGAGRWDKRWAERKAVLRNFFCGGGAGAAASWSQLLTVTAVMLVASPSEASLPSHSHSHSHSHCHCHSIANALSRLSSIKWLRLTHSPWGYNWSDPRRCTANM